MNLHKFSLFLIFLLLLLNICFAKHQVNFSYIISRDGQISFYDNNEPIFKFNTEEICLENMKLRPGGEVFVPSRPDGGFYFGWYFAHGHRHILDLFEIKELSKNKITLYVRCTEKNGNLYTNETYLDVFYNKKIRSYVYEVKSNFKVNKEFSVPQNSDGNHNHLPFQNLVPKGVYPDRDLKKFQMCIYQDTEGKYITVPFNRSLSPCKFNIKLKQNGIFGYFFNPNGNPIIQLLDKTSKETTIDICAWAYDVHFSLPISLDKENFLPGEYYEVNYRIFEYEGKKAEKIVKKAKIKEYDSTIYAAPLYEPDKENKFDKNILGKISTDWPWLPSSPGACKWTNEYGFDDTFCLKIENYNQSDKSFYWYRGVGEEYFPMPPIKGKYRFSAMVKTEIVDGYSIIGYQLREAFNTSPLIPITSCKGISGITDWHKVELETETFSGYINLVLILAQCGIGKTYFDNVEFIKVSE